MPRVRRERGLEVVRGILLLERLADQEMRLTHCRELVEQHEDLAVVRNRLCSQQVLLELGVHVAGVLRDQLPTSVRYEYIVVSLNVHVTSLGIPKVRIPR